MPSGRRPLFTIHESGAISAELWNRFAAIAKRDGGTIIAALADLMREYVARHDQPEQPPRPHE